MRCPLRRWRPNPARTDEIAFQDDLSTEHHSATHPYTLSLQRAGVCVASQAGPCTVYSAFDAVFMMYAPSSPLYRSSRWSHPHHVQGEGRIYDRAAADDAEAHRRGQRRAARCVI